MAEVTETAAAQTSEGTAKTPAADKGTTADTPAANAGAGAVGDTSKAFTQEDVDRIVAARLADEKKREANKQAEAAALAAGEHQKIIEARERELAEVRAELKLARLNNAVITEGRKAGVENTAALLRLIKDDVEWDANDAPANLERLIKAAIRDVPGLVTQAQTAEVKTPAANPGKDVAAAPQGPVSLYTPGLFKS